jgi:hypothetical protein
MQTVLLEASSETGAGGGSDSGFETVKSLAEEFVSVGPLELALLVVDVLAPALVALLVDDLPHHGILHGNTSEFTDIIRSGLVVLVRQTMWVRVVS